MSLSYTARERRLPGWAIPYNLPKWGEGAGSYPMGYPAFFLS